MWTLILLSVLTLLQTTCADSTHCLHGSRSGISAKEFIAMVNSALYVIADAPGEIHVTCMPSVFHGPGSQRYQIKAGLNILNTTFPFDLCHLISDVTIMVTERAFKLFSELDSLCTADFAYPVSALPTSYHLTNHPALFIGAVYNDTSVILSNSSYTDKFQLNAWQYKNDYNFRSLDISSSKPVALLYGDLEDQCWLTLLSKEFGAYNFIVPSNIMGRLTLKILATSPNTFVTVHNSSATYSMTVNNSAIFDAGLKPVVVQSTKPIFVYQYQSRKGYNNANSTKLVLIPGFENFEDVARFTSKDYISVIHLIYPESSIITVDMTPISANDAQSKVSLTADGKRYLLVTFVYPYDDVSRYRTIRCDNGTTPFGAIILAHTRDLRQTVYGYPLTFKTTDCLSHTRSTPLPTHPTSTTPVPTILTTPVPTILTTSTPTIVTRLPTNTAIADASHFCLQCDDLSDIYLCESLSKCSPNQVCYVERYLNWADHDRFRVGCKDIAACQSSPKTMGSVTSGIGKRETLCSECCQGNFCNYRGCGDKGFPVSVSRGPTCLSCAHVTSAQSCDTLAICESDEVCSIKVLNWFGGLRQYHFGCAKKACLKYAGKRSLATNRRTSVLCENCCADDFCNLTCDHSTPGVPPIVG